MTPEMNLAEIFAIHNPLDKECLKEVEQAASLARVPKRSVLLRQGDVCRHFYFNRSGLMRVAHIDDGTEDTVCFGTSGDVFTSLQSYFDGSPSIFSLVAFTTPKCIPFHTKTSTGFHPASRPSSCG